MRKRRETIAKSQEKDDQSNFFLTSHIGVFPLNYEKQTVTVLKKSTSKKEKPKAAKPKHVLKSEQKRCSFQ